jgi:poly(3-hydroxybutyrate) depolymerase
LPLIVSSPRLPHGGLHDALELWRVAAEGGIDYCARALARPGDAALDAMRLCTLLAKRGRPGWSTPHEIVHEWPVARLRDFSGRSRARVTPTLVLPPQAGHDSCIVDFAPGQSQMQAIRAAGLSRAWSLDWIGATPATKDAGIDDHVGVIDDAVERLGGRVNLIGDCQGGWLATIYAALRPARVNTLTIAGAPIDFHSGEPRIHAWVETLGMTFYDALVASGGGVLKGEHMLTGFIALKPQDELEKYVKLMSGVRDAAAVERHRRFEDWYKHTQDIPGRFYLWIVERLFRDNALIRGQLEVGGERVELDRIECPVNLIAGAKDHITPPDQVFAIASAVGSPAASVRKRLTPGGHLGLFMGHEALREHWPPVLADVLAASRDR